MEGSLIQIAKTYLVGFPRTFFARTQLKPKGKRVYIGLRLGKWLGGRFSEEGFSEVINNNKSQL